MRPGKPTDTHTESIHDYPAHELVEELIERVHQTNGLDPEFTPPDRLEMLRDLLSEQIEVNHNAAKR
jgi:hypothetical protein